MDLSSPPVKTHWESVSGEIWVNRLPSNRCHTRETDPVFEFPTSENTLGIRFR